MEGARNWCCWTSLRPARLPATDAIVVWSTNLLAFQTCSVRSNRTFINLVVNHRQGASVIKACFSLCFFFYFHACIHLFCSPLPILSWIHLLLVGLDWVKQSVYTLAMPILCSFIHYTIIYYFFQILLVHLYWRVITYIVGNWYTYIQLHSLCVCVLHLPI